MQHFYFTRNDSLRCKIPNVIQHSNLNDDSFYPIYILIKFVDKFTSLFVVRCIFIASVNVWWWWTAKRVWLPQSVTQRHFQGCYGTNIQGATKATQKLKCGLSATPMHFTITKIFYSVMKLTFLHWSTNVIAFTRNGTKATSKLDFRKWTASVFAKWHQEDRGSRLCSK